MVAPGLPEGVGLGDPVKQLELLNCFLAEEEGVDALGCDWAQIPPEPGTAEARKAQREFERAAAAYMRTDHARRAIERTEALLERAAGE